MSFWALNSEAGADCVARVTLAAGSLGIIKSDSVNTGSWGGVGAVAGHRKCAWAKCLSRCLALRKTWPQPGNGHMGGDDVGGWVGWLAHARFWLPGLSVDVLPLPAGPELIGVCVNKSGSTLLTRPRRTTGAVWDPDDAAITGSCSVGDTIEGGPSDLGVAADIDCSPKGVWS